MPASGLTMFDLSCVHRSVHTHADTHINVCDPSCTPLEYMHMHTDTQM